MVIINSPNNFSKNLINKAKAIINNKYVKIVLTILEFTIAIVSVGLIMDEQATGYIGLIIIIAINLYSIWKLRDFLKNMWAYIYHIAEKGAKAKRREKKLKQKQEMLQ